MFFYASVYHVVTGHLTGKTDSQLTDTIRYGRLTCAQKLVRWRLNLVHGTEMKKIRKEIKTKPSSSE